MWNSRKLHCTRANNPLKCCVGSPCVTHSCFLSLHAVISTSDRFLIVELDTQQLFKMPLCFLWFGLKQSVEV